MKFNVFGLLLLMMCILSGGCSNNSNNKTLSGGLSKSSIAFSEKAFKDNPDPSLFNLVYQNLQAIVNKDKQSFNETFDPGVDPSTYYYVMNQIERYTSIEPDVVRDKEKNQILITVRYDQNVPNSNGLTQGGRAYVLRQAPNGDWKIYTFD
jgi:hypothetical protein